VATVQRRGCVAGLCLRRGQRGATLTYEEKNMSITKFMALASILLLQACGTVAYTPTEYPLRDGLIPPIAVSGTATIINAQDSTAPAIVMSYGGTSYQTDYHAVTQTMVLQATSELQKAARARSGNAKSIALKVTFLESNYIAFFYKSKITFEAKLGDGTVINQTVPHSSGNPVQDLNGCIAEAAMTMLNDPKVRAYLAM